MRNYRYKSIEFICLCLFWFFASLIIGLTYPYFLIAQSVWLVIFIQSKSTKVPLDPSAVPMTPIVRLSYREYDQWAQKFAGVQQSFYEQTDVHWTEKMGVLSANKEAMSHLMQPSSSIIKMLFLAFPLGAYFFLPEMRPYLDELPNNQSITLQIFTGLVFGYLSGSACGKFYRWFMGKSSTDRAIFRHSKTSSYSREKPECPKIIVRVSNLIIAICSIFILLGALTQSVGPNMGALIFVLMAMVWPTIAMRQCENWGRIGFLISAPFALWIYLQASASIEFFQDFLYFLVLAAFIIYIVSLVILLLPKNRHHFINSSNWDDNPDLTLCKTSPLKIMEIEIADLKSCQYILPFY